MPSLQEYRAIQSVEASRGTERVPRYRGMPSPLLQDSKGALVCVQEEASDTVL